MYKRKEGCLLPLAIITSLGLVTVNEATSTEERINPPLPLQTDITCNPEGLVERAAFSFKNSASEVQIGTLEIPDIQTQRRICAAPSHQGKSTAELNLNKCVVTKRTTLLKFTVFGQTYHAICIE